MIYRLVSEVLLLVHLAFIFFVMAGGVLVALRPRIVWLHVPAVIWGALIEFRGWICPLTPLENTFRKLAGEKGYAGGFIEHYLLPLIYPESLTTKTQYLLGGLVLVTNALVYFWLWRRNTWKRSG
ncbi:MAG: DUF2784 domain-containing protein [Thiobacillaceae bacterium]|jgi:hypothetical protein